MFSTILVFSLFIQQEIPPSPVPAISVSETSSRENLKAWFLAQLIMDLGFNEEKIREANRLIDGCSDFELKVLVQVYKDRIAKRDQAEQARQIWMQQMVLQTATLDKQQAEAYRDHLKRVYDEKILQGKMETNLVRQNIQNQNRMMFGGYGNYGYRPYGIRGY